MVTFMAILLFIICIVLILLVLIQDSKGGGAMGMMGGGSSSSLWGASGAATFLEKVTRITAILFFVMSFALAWQAGKKSGSIVNEMPIPTPKTDTMEPKNEGNETTTDSANSPVPGAPIPKKQENK